MLTRYRSDQHYGKTYFQKIFSLFKFQNIQNIRIKRYILNDFTIFSSFHTWSLNTLFYNGEPQIFHRKYNYCKKKRTRSIYETIFYKIVRQPTLIFISPVSTIYLIKRKLNKLTLESFVLEDCSGVNTTLTDRDVAFDVKKNKERKEMKRKKERASV